MTQTTKHANQNNKHDQIKKRFAEMCPFKINGEMLVAFNWRVISNRIGYRTENYKNCKASSGFQFFFSQALLFFVVLCSTIFKKCCVIKNQSLFDMLEEACR
jgi:hypothetical protein